MRVTYFICIQFILYAVYLGRNECKNICKGRDSSEGEEARPLQGNFPILLLNTLNSSGFYSEHGSFYSFLFPFLFVNNNDKIYFILKKNKDGEICLFKF